MKSCHDHRDHKDRCYLESCDAHSDHKGRCYLESCDDHRDHKGRRYLESCNDHRDHKGPKPNPDSPRQVIDSTGLGEGEERLKVKEENNSLL